MPVKSRVLASLVALLALAAIAVHFYLSHPTSTEEQQTSSGLATTPTRSQSEDAPSAASTAGRGQKSTANLQTSASASVGLRPQASFELATDLYSFYQSALASNDGSLVAQAAKAVKECDGLLSWHGEHFGLISSGVKPAGDQLPESSARMAAVDELVRRCGGFIKMPKEERQRLAKDLSQSSSRLGAPEGDYLMSQGRVFNSNEVKVMLASPSGANFDPLVGSLANLVEGWEFSTPSLPKERVPDVASLSSMLALCELSDTCRPDSLRGLLGCVLVARCDISLTDGWAADFSAREQEAVLRYKDRLLQGVRSQDWSSLGLY